MNHEHAVPSPNKDSLVGRIGKTVLAIGGAYLGLKLGENILGYDMKDSLEIPLATTVGAASINAILLSRK